jgi:Flp pilus assembly pilin Flp
MGLRRLSLRLLWRDRGGFTKLEYGLLTAMLCAMVINGIATWSGGLGSNTKPMGTVQDSEYAPAGDTGTTTSAQQYPHKS